MSSFDRRGDKKAPTLVYATKHVELGVFEAEKYYNMEIDGNMSIGKDLRMGKLVCAMAKDQSVGAEPKAEARPKGFCPRTTNVGFSCFMRSLCAKEPMRLTRNGGIRSTKSCPETKSPQVPTNAAQAVTSLVKVSNKPKHSEVNKGNLIRNHMVESDNNELGVVRKRAEIEESLEKKLAVLTWDAIPGAKKVQTIKKVDGYESDASSELFEIESLSVSTRQSVSTSTRQGSKRSYAPTPTNSAIPPRLSVEKRSPGGLLSCSGHKSTLVYEPIHLKPKPTVPQQIPKLNALVLSSV